MLSFLKREIGQTIFVNNLDNLIGTIHLIDIREPEEVRFGTIETAVNIPMGKLLNNPEHYLKKDEPYYLMCQSGMRSARATSQLRKAGYEVINVKGGFSAYTGKFAK